MFNDIFEIISAHYIGIIGSLLMLSGVIYSFKKRWDVPKGSIAFWLKHHEFVCVLGAVLVIIHGDFEFYGLAGLSSIMMVTMVISGFFGHYIYTRIPRNQLGKEKKLEGLKKDLAESMKEINDDPGSQSEVPQEGEPGPDRKGFSRVSGYFRSIGRLVRDDISDWKKNKTEGGQELTTKRKIEMLKRQIDRLETARRLLSGWRTWHIPFSIIFVITVIVHMVSILFFGNYFG